MKNNNIVFVIKWNYLYFIAFMLCYKDVASYRMKCYHATSLKQKVEWKNNFERSFSANGKMYKPKYIFFPKDGKRLVDLQQKVNNKRILLQIFRKWAQPNEINHLWHIKKTKENAQRKEKYPLYWSFERDNINGV